MALMAARALLVCFSLIAVANLVQAGPVPLLLIGDRLNTGDKSTQGPYEFSMQQDCNLVARKNDEIWDLPPFWTSKTGGASSGCYFILQHDGNGVIYNPKNKPIWSTGTSGYSVSYLMIECDGHVVLYTTSNKAVWTTRQKPSTGSLLSGVVSTANI